MRKFGVISAFNSSKNSFTVAFPDQPGVVAELLEFPAEFLERPEQLLGQQLAVILSVSDDKKIVASYLKALKSPESLKNRVGQVVEGIVRIILPRTKENLERLGVEAVGVYQLLPREKARIWAGVSLAEQFRVNQKVKVKIMDDLSFSIRKAYVNEEENWENFSYQVNDVVLVRVVGFKKMGENENVIYEFTEFPGVFGRAFKPHLGAENLKIGSTIKVRLSRIDKERKVILGFVQEIL